MGSVVKGFVLMGKRVLIVDDNHGVRKELQQLIEMELDFEVCGLAADGREAIAIAARCAPDLIILDLAMPVMTGLEAAPHLVKALPRVVIILFTMYETQSVLTKARSAGIHAVVSKETPYKLLEQARSLLQAQPG